jgi:hypothetical protein
MSSPLARRRRPGRPRFAFGRKRNFSLYLRLTAKELSLIVWRAALAGVCPSCLARDFAVYTPTPVPSVRRVSPASIQRLARLGHLLNQSMRQVHGGQPTPELSSILEEIYGVLSGLLASLEVEPE